MDLSQVYVPRSEFKDLRKGMMSQHSHAEVVIIDRSPTGSQHQVYQLKAEYITYCDNLDRLRQEFQRLNRDAFIVLGDLLEIEMTKKTLRLTNGDVVTYKYLLLFNGNEQPIELETALHTLKDALIIEAIKIKDRMNLMALVARQKPPHSFSIPEEKDSVERVAQPVMNSQSGDSHSIDLGSTARSLCQVQL